MFHFSFYIVNGKATIFKLYKTNANRYYNI
jgi:hypothetical protein